MVCRVNERYKWLRKGIILLKIYILVNFLNKSDLVWWYIINEIEKYLIKVYVDIWKRYFNELWLIVVGKLLFML